MKVKNLLWALIWGTIAPVSAQVVTVDVRTACHPQDVKHYDTERLRSNFAVEHLFPAGELYIYKTVCVVQIAAIHTDNLLIDVAISFKSGKTYWALGYEDTLMMFQIDKPFDPAYLKRYKEDLKKFLDLAAKL